MLETKAPREQVGRDTFSRYRAQIRSAALASLSILEGGEVDRIYCDLHDDFVLRLNRGGDFFYVFYQVKTHSKQNHNWTLNEVFGINSRIKIAKKHDSKNISNSFAGRLLLHTVSFGDNCEAVIFQTNVNIEDNINNLLADIAQEELKTPTGILLLDRFKECFSCDGATQNDIKRNLRKIAFETDVQYLKPKNDNFEPTARDAIYRYSEVDLSRDEARDILLKLVDLVQTKSSGVIKDLTHESIEEMAGISISDLLDILSISREAYRALVEGGDPLAVKNASIIQRTLVAGGATPELIEFCSRCKIQWDNWFRKNRHILPEIEVLTIQSESAQIFKGSIENGALIISKLQAPIEEYLQKLVDSSKNFDLNNEIILGGVLAELVRSQQ